MLFSIAENVALASTGEGDLAQASCQAMELSDWSAAETWAWRQSYAGLVANFHQFEKQFDPRKKENCTKDRLLGNRFIETILGIEAYQNALTRSGVHIIGSCLTGSIDLSNAKLMPSI